MRGALTEVEAVAGRALELVNAAQEVFLGQPLLTAISISCAEQQSGWPQQVPADTSSSGMGAAGSESDGGWLLLTLVEPDAKAKVEVGLRLRELLAHDHQGGQEELAVDACVHARCSYVRLVFEHTCCVHATAGCYV